MSVRNKNKHPEKFGVGSIELKRITKNLIFFNKK